MNTDLDVGRDFPSQIEANRTKRLHRGCLNLMHTAHDRKVSFEMKSRKNVLPLVVLFSLGCVAFGGADQSPLRIVRGRVLDAHNLPLPSAIVYLQNLRIQRIRTCITDEQGRYHFAGLIPFDDYTVRASYQSWTSKTHALPHFDSKLDLLIDLKVDKNMK